MNPKLINFLLLSALVHSILLFTNWHNSKQKNNAEHTHRFYAQLSKEKISSSTIQQQKHEQGSLSPSSFRDFPQVSASNKKPEILKTPPQLRIGPNLTIQIDGSDDQTCKLFLEINERGRVTNVISIGNTSIPQGILETIMTAFRNEAIFIPSTVDGTPCPGNLILEITLFKSP